MAPSDAFPFAGQGGGWHNACCTYALFPLLGCMARSGLRREYGIAGSHVLDLWLSLYCSACATCQAWREVQIRRTAAEAALWEAAAPVGGQTWLPQGSFQVPSEVAESSYVPPQLQQAVMSGKGEWQQRMGG